MKSIRTFLAKTNFLSIRLKLSAVFVALSLAIGGFVIGAVNMQFRTVERATLVEAEHFVGTVAYAGAGNALSAPQYLQKYVDGLFAEHGRDLDFLDMNKREIADAERQKIGTVFNEDAGNEVAQSIRDGEMRIFVERNGSHPQGIKRIVVPLHEIQANSGSPIVGAAIVDYGHIYDGLLRADRTNLYLLAVSGLGCVLLTIIFGLRVAAKMAARLKGLQEGADVIAEGNYGTKVSVTSRDELGRLGESFNTMAGALMISRNQLEERVVSRTAALTRLNRVHAVLSGINALIVRVKDRDELFHGACRISREAGGFTLAWIGVLEREANVLVPVAWAGPGQEHADRLRLRVDDASRDGVTLASQAVREKRPVISNDVARDPRVILKAAMAAEGMGSAVVLPLIIDGAALGTLTLVATEIGFFDDTEMQLLEELARNIAFAIDHIGKQERLEYIAYHDELTGLANRTLFLERVTQHMRNAASGGHKLGLFLIDLERFRNINDSLGRPAGDALLKQVAQWLTRDSGDASLVARIGADHFAAVLPEVLPEQGARSLKKSMSAFMEHPFHLNDAVFRVALKIGVATFPDDGADADTLFRNAEAALKKAKATGERFVFYAQSMNARIAEKLTLENQLRHALDRGEFVLHYQPKVDLESGKLTSAEALIRWNDPRTGLVPPGRFIPILEETGLIQDVGRWALRQAIADYLRWRRAGLPAVRIAVNVSPLQLRNRAFTAEVREAIGIDPQAAAGLELEITESLIMENVEHNIASLRAIRALGVTIAIDDFGTGFSSLSYLSKLPIDTLKIDRSFVIDMTSGPEGLALVSTIINLAHSLKLKVVAEGVETQEQSHLLRLLRCNEMQGFLFSKAVPAEIFETRFLAPAPRRVAEIA